MVVYHWLTINVNQGVTSCHFLPFQCSITGNRAENPPTAQALLADGA
jgi:hypothetical protein